MKKSIFILILFVTTINYSQTKQNDKQSILAVLDKQVEAWNDYDINGFMEGYWKSDSLKFYGKGGITKGYENTLNRYKKVYPTKEQTGKLSFKINDISQINKAAYFVLGEYYLTRTVGDANGIFMIILKKINGKWKIIADTSS